MASYSTWASAKARCHQLGFTVRATRCGAERAIYPKGTPDPLNAEVTYFTDDPQDAVGTVRAMVERAKAQA